MQLFLTFFKVFVFNYIGGMIGYTSLTRERNQGYYAVFVGFTSTHRKPTDRQLTLRRGSLTV